MLEEDIVTALTGLADDRVYPLVVPEGAAFPNIVYQRISGGPINSVDGFAIGRPRIQISCHAEDYGSAKSLADAVKTALASLASVIADDRDQYDKDAKIFTTQIDFLIWDKGA